MVSDIAAEILRAFRCERCGAREAKSQLLVDGAASLMSMPASAASRIMAITCRHCGRVELFDPHVLTGRADRAELLRTIFAERATPG